MKLSSRALMVTFAKFTSLGMTMLIGIFLSRLLSKEDYGDYRQVWLLFQTISPLLILSIDDSVMFYLPQLEESRHRGFLLQTAGLLGILGLGLSAIFFWGSNLIASAYSPTVAPYLRTFALYPVFFLPSLIAPLWLIAIHRTIGAAVMMVAFEIPRALGTIALVMMHADLNIVFFWVVVLSGANCLVMLWWIGRVYPHQALRPDWKLFRTQWSYSFPLGIAKIFSTILKRVSNNIVAITFSAGAFAVFTNGAFELPFTSPITNAVMLVLVAEFVRLGSSGSYGKILRLWLESLRRMAALVYPTTVFFFQFAGPTMVFLFSDKYVDSAIVFRIFTLALPLRIATYSAVLRALDRTGWIFWTTAASLAITLGFSVVLLPWLGILGPAWATVIGDYVMVGVFLWLIARLLKVTVWQVYPWKELLKLAVLSLLAAIPSQLLIVPRHWPAWASLLVGSLVYGVTYLGLGLVTRILRRSDLDFLFDLIRKIPWPRKKAEIV